MIIYGALAERGWPGDAELGEQLQALLGTGPTPLLRALSVDLAELADILEGDPIHGGGLLDLRTGQVWPQAAIDYAADSGEQIAGAPGEDVDPDRWLPVECAGSRQGYQDMEIFIDTLTDPSWASDRGLPFTVEGRSAGSKTCSHAPPTSWTDGSPSPKNANTAEPGPGWPTPDTSPGHLLQLASPPA